MAAEEDASLCSVCREIYSDPRVLQCGHSFCLECIKGIADNSNKFPCPICRRSVNLGYGKVDQLPKNFGLSNVIEAKDKTHPSMCLKHKRSLDIFCAGCDMVICSKCLLMQHKEHVIEDIDKIFTERNTKLATLLDITKQLALEIEKTRQFVEQSRKCMQKNADSIHKTVDQSFKKWSDALDMRQNTVLVYLLQERDKKIQVHDNAEIVLKSSMTNVTALKTEINKIRSKDSAFVVQQYGSIWARQESIRRKVLLDIMTCFTPPEDLKIEVCAPWIEEAIQNIKPIDMMQKKPKTQKISRIQRENTNLKREQHSLNKRLEELKEKDIKQLDYENMILKTLLTDLHKYTTSHTEVNDNPFELPSTIESSTTVATQYRQAQDIYHDFKERIQSLVSNLESASTANKQLQSDYKNLQNTNQRIQQKNETLQKWLFTSVMALILILVWIYWRYWRYVRR